MNIQDDNDRVPQSLAACTLTAAYHSIESLHHITLPARHVALPWPPHSVAVMLMQVAHTDMSRTSSELSPGQAWCMVLSWSGLQRFNVLELFTNLSCIWRCGSTTISYPMLSCGTGRDGDHQDSSLTSLVPCCRLMRSGTQFQTSCMSCNTGLEAALMRLSRRPLTRLQR